ncbi:uncharacterized protein LOC114761201 [Neltuma alba]|uniref:uncharacterized protein LOC114761201 n=1 Tax=Neltuma alba TaxID=207710 RepID=UPI0010A49753|nr:uncharacterized protein LOC114761201 [Prosopis alba]
MTDLGTMSYFLGMEIKQDQQGIFINQKKYAKEILNRFGMEGSKAIATPMNQKEKLSKNDAVEKDDEGIYRSLIGYLMHLTTTRPDILYAVSVLSRFLHCATLNHYKAVKRVIRYIKGTLDYGIRYKRNQVFKLEGCSDLEWGGSLDDMKSTFGYCFILSFGVFSWSSKKQEVVAQSTAETESIAANTAVKQAL